MSFDKQGVGLSWPTLFTLKKNQLDDIVKSLQSNKIEYNQDNLVYNMNLISDLNFHNYDNAIKKACESVALKFILIDSDLGLDLLSSEEYNKSLELFSRKQFNSKILQKLLLIFCYLLNNYSNERITNLFTLSILSEYQIFKDEEINNSYSDLKKVIDKVASGVKSDCYVQIETKFNIVKLNDNLNNYLITNFNYDFNQTYPYQIKNDSTILFNNEQDSITNEILQHALLDNDKFWEKHINFSITKFINKVEELNDYKHAEKIIKYIFNNIIKMTNMDIVFENKFPLFISRYDILITNLEDQAKRFSFKKLIPFCDISPINNINICYPMNKANDESLLIGKNLWMKFIYEYNYPLNGDKVNDYLTTEVKKFTKGESHKADDIAVILDTAPFRWGAADNDDRKIFSAYHPDCFSYDNIWNRVYLKAYAVTKLSKNEQEQFFYLHRIFFDLLKTIEKEKGICTIHQINNPNRDKKYIDLKNLLYTFEIEIDDKFKNDYIISLLDRDTATIDEDKRFPALEQLGDAIYGFCVAEMLFYNPNATNIQIKYKEYIKAESQVIISKKHGFDKLYLQLGCNSKYNDIDSMYFDINTINFLNDNSNNKEKYLADSLEMIIGTIYLDKGLETAVIFTKKLLTSSFPNEFNQEIHLNNETKFDKNIDKDYWSQILPSPCSQMTNETHMMWEALDKMLLTISLGTDDINKRKYITNSFGNTTIYGETNYFHIYWVLYEYLTNGIYSTLNKYSNIIQTNYNNNIK